MHHFPLNYSRAAQILILLPDLPHLPPCPPRSCFRTTFFPLLKERKHLSHFLREDLFPFSLPFFLLAVRVSRCSYIALLVLSSCQLLTTPSLACFGCLGRKGYAGVFHSCFLFPFFFFFCVLVDVPFRIEVMLTKDSARGLLSLLCNERKKNRSVSELGIGNGGSASTSFV